MKVAIVHPTNWPYVRRGTERFMNEFARFLAGRGHSVKIVTSACGPHRVFRNDGFVTEFHRSLWRPAMARVGLLDFHVFPATTFAALLRERFDIVHCFNFTDVLAAAAIRRLNGNRVVFHINSIPPAKPYRRSLSLGGALVGHAIRAADEILTGAASQAEYFCSRFGRRGVTIRVPVDLERFRFFSVREQARPVILCASALDDRRKGGRFLMRAFNAIKAKRPEIVLKVSAQISAAVREELTAIVDPQWRPDVHFLTPSERELPGMFGEASVLVLPSLWEAYPMVLLEAFATGTPVVASHEGGAPEIVAAPFLGRTFDPGPPVDAEPSNLQAFTEAVLEVLEMSRLPDTAIQCRAHAEAFGWAAIGPQYEGVYKSVLGTLFHNGNAETTC